MIGISGRRNWLAPSRARKSSSTMVSAPESASCTDLEVQISASQGWVGATGMSATPSSTFCDEIVWVTPHTA
jgi:hypothetical protein